MRQRSNEDDTRLVHDLVRVASDIRTSVLKNPLEKIEQRKCYDVLMRMVATLVSLDRLDKTKLQMIFVKQRTNFVLPLRKEAQVYFSRFYKIKF